jgi:hypothetical protein
MACMVDRVTPNHFIQRPTRLRCYTPHTLKFGFRYKRDFRDNKDFKDMINNKNRCKKRIFKCNEYTKVILLKKCNYSVAWQAGTKRSAVTAWNDQNIRIFRFMMKVNAVFFGWSKRSLRCVSFPPAMLGCTALRARRPRSYKKTFLTAQSIVTSYPLIRRRNKRNSNF